MKKIILIFLSLVMLTTADVINHHYNEYTKAHGVSRPTDYAHSNIPRDIHIAVLTTPPDASV
jgi:hypothetical protein